MFCCPPTPAINRTGERINPKGLIRTPGLSIFWGLAFLRFGKEQKYPGYDFAHNAGYGTKKHLEGLAKQGFTDIHRQSFEPIKSMIHHI